LNILYNILLKIPSRFRIIHIATKASTSQISRQETTVIVTY